MLARLRRSACGASVRATPTGHASRSRCRSCRWPPCGPVRRSIDDSARLAARMQQVADLVARAGAAPHAASSRRRRTSAPSPHRSGDGETAASVLALLAGLFNVLNERARAASWRASIASVPARRSSPRRCRGDNDKLRAMQSDATRRCSRDQPDDAAGHVGDSDLSGPPPGHELRLRRARRDRADGCSRWRATIQQALE